MQKQSLDIQTRTETGKGPARRLRAEGKIPAVVYGLGSSTSITVDRKELTRILNSGASQATLFMLKFDGAGPEKLAIIRDFTTDPVKSKLTHADFQEISADKTIQVTIPVMLAAGDPAGVKLGGILSHPTREVHIECLPNDIPGHIEVDASGLQIGGSIHLGAVAMPSGVKVLSDLDLVVASIAAPVSQEKLDEMLSTSGEVAEPEMLKKPEEE